MNPSILIVSTSTSSSSRSRTMAHYCENLLKDDGRQVNFLNLAHDGLSIDSLLADAGQLARVRNAFLEATHIIFAVPIYLFDVASPVKRLVESLSRAELGNRTVGFVCAAGSAHSFMSVMPFASALMLNFRCWIVPRFVYGTPDDFVDHRPVDALAARLSRLCTELLSIDPHLAAVSSGLPPPPNPNLGAPARGEGAQR